MNADQVWGIVRTILAAGGGYIVAKGYVDNATLQSILGALGTLFVAGWSIWSNRSAKLAAPAAATPAK